MNRPKKLSASFVKAISQPGRYGDGRGGHGLSLLVKPMTNGRLSKTWCQRIQRIGRVGNIGLGPYPVVTLAEARTKALANRRAITQGRDPRGEGIPTFEEAAEKVIAIHSAGWKGGGKSAKQWRASLRDYAMPMLGRKRVDEITTADVMAVLTPHWQAKKETMRRVKQRISRIMMWSTAQGYRADDPAGVAINAALPKNDLHRKHHRALPHAEVGAALNKMGQSGAYPATILCFEFLTLCAVRSSEARLAKWQEIDLATATWTIPSSRMKSKREHRVPLPMRAVDVLETARMLADGSGLIFPSPSGRALSDSTISKLCRENKIGCVPHGMRSSFRDWAAECTDAPREVCEQALAHVNPNKIESAYRRSDLFERRRALMEKWAAYIGEGARNG